MFHFQLKTDTFKHSVQIGRYTPAFINFNVKLCPYGFEMSDSKCHCVDALKNMLHGIECYISGQLFTRPGNAEWWMGFDHGSTLIFSQYCPFDYCRQSVKDIDLNDGSHECGFKGTGILCGRCSKGLSIMSLVLQHVQTVAPIPFRKHWD